MNRMHEVLPGTGRGTIRRMVEGQVGAVCELPASPSTSFAGPPPRSGEDGFTLVELMVVLVIIGLLTAIVAFNVLPQQDKAMVQTAKVNIDQIDQALEMYKLNNLAFPSSGEGLQALVTKDFIKKLPNDPWGRPYRYDNPGRRGDVDVYSLGADGTEGGEEDNADIGNWQ